jgi:hypothetical protein
VLFIEHNRAPNSVEHRANNFELIQARVSPATDCRHAAVNGGRSIWHCSHDWHFVALAACGRGELLFEETCRYRSRNGDNQRVGADFGSDLLQHFRNGLRFYCQQKNVSAFDRFAIVGGDRNAELLRERSCSLPVLYGRNDPIGQKQSLLQICAQQDATQFSGTDYREFFV